MISWLHVSYKCTKRRVQSDRPLDLFLISPPPGASHRPVKPSHIVIAGDSAGGGLSLALLQVIRDTGLPMPAGGVLISPWCDLTHTFPSVHTNTHTVSMVLLFTRDLY